MRPDTLTKLRTVAAALTTGLIEPAFPWAFHLSCNAGRRRRIDSAERASPIFNSAIVWTGAMWRVNVYGPRAQWTYPYQMRHWLSPPNYPASIDFGPEAPSRFG